MYGFFLFLSSEDISYALIGLLTVITSMFAAHPGKAQQAYAAMSSEHAGDYEEVKEPYCADMIHQKRRIGRAAVKKEDEVVRELAVRL